MAEEIVLTKDAEVIKRWREKPWAFVREAIGVEPTNQQESGLRILGEFVSAKIKSAKGGRLSKREKDLAEKIGLSIRSGHGTGKDAFLSWVYIWLLTCFPYPKGLATGPTSHQLDIVLWPEIRKWLRGSRAELHRYLEVQADKVFNKDYKSEWFIAKRTASVKGGPEEQGETLAGLHADYMIHAVDEASGVPDGVFKPLEGALTGLLNIAILIGNMTRSNGYFYDSHFTDARKFWVPLHWDCEDSNIDEITGLTTMSSYVQRMADKYGRDSNFFQIRVKGNPPLSEPDALIPYEWVMKAKDRVVEPDEYDPVMIGVDPGAGGDSSVVLDRKGLCVNDIREYNTKDTMELVGNICLASRDLEPDAIMVDVIGIGNGVYNRLMELRYPAYPVNVSESASKEEQFMRLRDELFWRLRGFFEAGTISIPDDDELIGELSSIKYKAESNGKVKIESKREMRGRGMESPNKADALMLSFAIPDYVFSKKRVKDPYDEEIEEFRTKSWMSA
jgi:phage terminase large subunit